MKNIVFTSVLNALLVLAAGFVFNCDSNLGCTECPLIDDCLKTVKCGCCSICIPILKEHAICISIFHTIMQSPAECEPGLLCNPYSKKCTRDFSFLKSFDHITCKAHLCHCSYGGKRLETYQHLKVTEITPESCNCAHTKEKYQRSMNVGRIFMCTKTGGYENIQCRGSVCYCVDEKGNEITDVKPFKVGYMSNPC